MSKLFLEKPLGFKPSCEVSTVFMEYEGTLLLLLCSRCEASPNKWAIPGGKLERDESPRGALIREIDEELGLSACISDLVFVRSVYI